MKLRVCVMVVGVFTAFFAGQSTFGQNVVFSEDFSKVKSLEESGWNVVKGKATKFEFKDGCLEIICGQAPYKGGDINRIVPLVTSGELTFEVALNTNHAKYDHFTLRIKLYGMMLAFKKNGSRSKLMRYYNKKWKDLSLEIPIAKKFKVKMVFDDSTGGVQYFVNDMDSPVMVEENVRIATPPPKKPSLIIANYGLASGELLNKLYSVKLTGK